MTNDQMREYAGWRNLVAALQDAGAVTPEDCQAAQGDDSTPGRRLFQAIRTWADDVVAQRCEDGPEGCKNTRGMRNWNPFRYVEGGPR